MTANAAPRSRPDESAVLVVEDEALIRLMLIDALEDHGYRVFAAERADAAVRLLEENEDIGLVVTDVRMPGAMDGLRLAQWIREHRPGTKVVVTSGYVSRGEQKAFAAEFDRFVGKPYAVTELIEVLRSLRD
ncbi:MAG TPA: response regulator [Herpetosiphonaceae bacterium]|jgi:CheY-like chemotaxis protein|nr:response regulator [Herpetosiphonaceae bacterium]